MPSLSVFVADTHLNSRVAMCPLSYRFRGNGEFRANKSQRALHRRWLASWDIVYQMQEQLDASLYVHIVGDAMDINVHDNIDPISRYEPDVIELGETIFRPIVERADYTFFYRGTAAHDQEHGKLTEELATLLLKEGLPVVPNEQEGYNSWGWFWGEIDGVTFDVTHHPKTTTRIRSNRASAAARQQRQVRDGYLDRGDKPPDIGVYAHGHFWADSGTTFTPRVFFLPPWVLANSYGDRLGVGGDIEPVGLLTVICDAGKYEANDMRWEFPRRRKPWVAE